MKKIIISFLLGGIVFSSITVGAAYVYTARDIGYTPNDENWNVTNASEAISSLKEDLYNVNNNVSEYKNNIAQTLTDNGITINSNDSFETIDNNIDDGINNYKSQINTCNSNYSTLNTNFTNYKKGVTTALKNKGASVTESSTLAQIQTAINNMSIEPTLITDSTTKSRNTSTTNSFSLSFVKDGIYVVMLSGDCKSNNWGNMSKGISGVTILKTTSVTNSNGNAGVNGGSTLWLVKATGTSGSVYLNSPDSDWVSGRVIVQRIM